MSRRSFLGGATAVTGVSVFSSLLGMQFFASAAAAQDGGDDYRALVCIFLEGGNDCYNMLVPTSPTEFPIYRAARGERPAQPLNSIGLRADAVENRGPYLELALDPSSANRVDAAGNDRGFALHPAMGKVRTLFEQGTLAFVANVGALSEPLTKAEYLAARDGSGGRQIPPALFSHSDQVKAWRSGQPDVRLPDGWAGRFPESLARTGPPAAAYPIPMHISVAGANTWQMNSGEGTYVISGNGSSSFLGHDDSVATSAARVRFEGLVGGANIGRADSFAGQSSANVFKQRYLTELDAATAMHDQFSAAFDSGMAQVPGAPDDDPTSLYSQLRAVAASMVAHQALGVRRQVFFVENGSWDHHSRLLVKHNAMLGELTDSIDWFWNAVDGLGMGDAMVGFTASEFGRTLARTGGGSGHAWGSHHMVFGGPVDGQKIFGHYPEDLTIGGPNDVETLGRILPTTSIDAFGTEMARWFGVTSQDVPVVFPNAAKFFDPAEAHPVGFLQ